MTVGVDVQELEPSRCVVETIEHSCPIRGKIATGLMKIETVSS